MVDMRELKDLRKLPPRERLERLRDIEKRKKKEEEETRKIITESLRELNLDDMLREIEVPDQEKVDIDKLLDRTRDIEDGIDEEQLSVAVRKGGTDYAGRIQELLPDNTLEEIHNWYRQDNVSPSREEFLEVYESARAAYETLQQNMQKGPDQQLYSSPSEELVENVVSSMRLLRSLGYEKGFFDGNHP